MGFSSAHTAVHDTPQNGMDFSRATNEHERSDDVVIKLPGRQSRCGELRRRREQGLEASRDLSAKNCEKNSERWNRITTFGVVSVQRQFSAKKTRGEAG